MAPLKLANDKTQVIVLGGGCFWCTEAIYKNIKGVLEVTPGYAGGTTKNPTYKEVCSGKTGHAEVVQILYDTTIDFETLLEVFFKTHDPTSHHRQGNDVGSEYRSMILYTTDEQKRSAEVYLQKIQSAYSKPIVTELKKLEVFYPAEDYHNNYYENNPLQPYCMFVISPKISKLQKQFKSLLK